MKNNTLIILQKYFLNLFQSIGQNISILTNQKMKDWKVHEIFIWKLIPKLRLEFGRYFQMISLKKVKTKMSNGLRADSIHCICLYLLHGFHFLYRKPIACIFSCIYIFFIKPLLLLYCLFELIFLTSFLLKKKT